MRISSRGTVSMGPLGWLIIGPFLLAGWLVYWAAAGLVWLVMTGLAALADRQRRRKADGPLTGRQRRALDERVQRDWPNIPPSG